MPVRAARSETRGRPPSMEGDASWAGNRGSISDQRASGNNSVAIAEVLQNIKALRRLPGLRVRP